MEIDLDHPTLSHLLGYLSVRQWVDAIRQRNVNIEIAYELLKIQDRAWHGNMVDDVKEVVAMSQEDYIEWRKSEEK